jgi:glycerol-1-phosphate dehydrogenase [NAD(P)+]
VSEGFAGPERAALERFMALPRYLRVVEGAEALGDALAEIRRRLGLDRLCVISGPSASRPLAERLAAALGSPPEVRVASVAENSAAAVRELISSEVLSDADAALAVGGGRTIDVVKAACLELDLPVISCPTQLAADGIASPVSVIRSDGGEVQSLPGRLPAAVVCDLEVIAAAPPETARAGLGDLVANVTAIRDWRLAAAAGREDLDDLAVLLAQAGADLALASDTSSLASESPERGLLGMLVEGLVLSGMAMEVAGSSRPCSGAEHLISHALDRDLPGTALHGEQVALGTLVAARLQGSDWRRLRDVLARAGLASALAGFDLGHQRLAELIRAAPSTRPGRYTVLDEADLSEAALVPVLEEIGVG